MSRSIKKRPVEVPRPILYYSFNDDFVSGSTLRDVMGANNGTLVGGVTTSAMGRVGQAFDFNGTTGLVRTADDPLFEPHVGASGVSTWSCIIHPRDIGGGGNRPLFSKLDNLGVDQEFSCFLRSAVPGSLQFTIQDPTGVNVVSYFSTPLLANNVTSHVAIVFDNTEATSTKVRMFFNGQEVATTNSTSGSYTQMTSTSSDFAIGAWFPDSPSAWFDGLIEEFLWFDTVLTDIQIAELSSRSLARKRAFAQVPVTDYSIWWSARNVDGQGNATLSSPNVATLTDLGSTGADATQGTTSDQPWLRPFRAGQRAGIYCDGVDDVMGFTQQTFSDFTVFLLTQPLIDMTSGITNRMLVTNAADSGARGQFVFGQIGDRFAVDEVVSVIHNTNLSTELRGLANSDDAFIVASSRNNMLTLSSSNRVRVNGQELVTQDCDPSGGGGTAQPGSLAGFGLERIDSLFGRNIGNHYDGIVFELLIYNRHLTESEILQVENWMAEEYPDLEFQQLVFATNPDTTVEDEPVIVNVEAAGQYPEPIAYWSFDNADLVSATIIDLVSGNNGTNNGATTGVVGQVGQAFTFNGTTNYVSVARPDAPFDFDLADPVTFSAWFKTSGGSGQCIFGKYDTNVTSGYNLTIRASGEIIYNMTDSAVSGIRVQTTETYDDGSWHNIVCTYDGSSDASGVNLYVDGVLTTMTTVENTNPGSILNNVDFDIGRQLISSVGDQWFNGELDELAVWSAELTANEVFEVYRRGAQGLKLVE